jgi:hypothetical protein
MSRCVGPSRSIFLTYQGASNDVQRHASYDLRGRNRGRTNQPRNEFYNVGQVFRRGTSSVASVFGGVDSVGITTSFDVLCLRTRSSRDTPERNDMVLCKEVGMDCQRCALVCKYLTTLSHNHELESGTDLVSKALLHRLRLHRDRQLNPSVGLFIDFDTTFT